MKLAKENIGIYPGTKGSTFLLISLLRGFTAPIQTTKANGKKYRTRRDSYGFAEKGFEWIGTPASERIQEQILYMRG